MSHRSLALKSLSAAALVMLVVVWALPAPVEGQGPPRTAWGAPDLQGVWTSSTLTPLERPTELAGNGVEIRRFFRGDVDDSASVTAGGGAAGHVSGSACDNFHKRKTLLYIMKLATSYLCGTRT